MGLGHWNEYKIVFLFVCVIACASFRQFGAQLKQPYRVNKKIVVFLLIYFKINKSCDLKRPTVLHQSPQHCLKPINNSKNPLVNNFCTSERRTDEAMFPSVGVFWVLQKQSFSDGRCRVLIGSFVLRSNIAGALWLCA